MKQILAFASDLAKEVGKITLDYFHPNGIGTSLKADDSAVTEADLAADAFIRAAIQEHFPEDGLLTEEANTTFPDGKGAVWVIDPLDGTTNFSLGLHHWGVSIARLIDGQPDTAALYFPLINELYTAQRNQGAFLNGMRLFTRLPDSNNPFSFFACCSRTHRKYNVSVPYKARIFGSAAYGLVTVARGCAALAFEVTPKIWDFSASWLVTREAGGVIGVLDADSPFPLMPGVDYEGKSYPTLAAATPELWEKGRQKITLK